MTRQRRLPRGLRKHLRRKKAAIRAKEADPARAAEKLRELQERFSHPHVSDRKA